MDERPKDRRNEPKYLVHIPDELAYYLDEDMEDLADVTFQNTKRFLNI